MQHSGYFKAFVLSAVILLAGCLPDDSQTSAVNGGQETTAQAKMDYVAQSLSSYALRSQYELAKSDKWRTGDFPENKINMASAGMGGAAKLATSAFCRDGAGSAYHLTWPKEKNSANGSMISALSKRVASDSLGMIKEDGRIVTQAGKDITLSATCKTNLSASMPIGAPVIVMALSLPANTDMAGQTKVLFETVACSGEREKGYTLIKVITKYDSAGKVETGYPRRENANGGTCVEIALMDVKSADDQTSILSNAGGFGSGGIGQLLGGSLGTSKVDCTKTKQEIITGYDKKGNPIVKKVDVVDSCAAATADNTLIDAVKEDDVGGDHWEPNKEVGYCQNGNGSKNNVDMFGATGGVWTWGDWKGKYYSKRWNDYRKVTETRGGETKTDTQIIRGPWIGDYAECFRKETYVADCRTIPAVLEFGVPYVSTNPVEVLNGLDKRSFRTDWQVSWIRGWLGCVFGCTKVIKYDVSILDENYYRGLEVEGEIYLERQLDIKTFDNPEKFKLSKPIENPWVYNRDKATCSVNKREALFGCTSDDVRDTGSVPGFGGWKTLDYGEEVGSYDGDLHAHLEDQRWELDNNIVNAEGRNIYTYKRTADFLEPKDIEYLYNYPRTADGAVLTSFNYGYDSDYLISRDGKGNPAYVSDYVVRIDLGKKKKSLFSSKTTRDSYAVDRVYIDADKKGYQIVRKQGYYYKSRKVDFDGTKFFLTDDASNTSNVPTQCLARRYKSGSVHEDYSYDVSYDCGSSESPSTCTETIVRKFWMYPVDFHTYVGVTPEKGRKSATASSNLCVTEKTPGSGGYGYYGNTEKKFWRCDTPPTTCAEKGMQVHTVQKCEKWGYGIDAYGEWGYICTKGKMVPTCY